MKKLIPALLAGVLLLVGATVALAQTEEPDTSTTTTADDGTAADDGVLGPHDRGEVLDDVLGELVENGTLTQAQADAVTDALDAKKSEFEARRDELRAAWDEAWADDVLTEDEVAELVGDGPFADRVTDPDGPFADYWADGQLTKDELAEAREQLGMFGRPGHHGHHGRFAPGEDTES